MFHVCRTDDSHDIVIKHLNLFFNHIHNDCLFLYQGTTSVGTVSLAGTNGVGFHDDTIDHSLIPLFLTEFILEPIQILFSPDLDEYQDGIAEVITEFQNCVLGVINLVPDNYFDAFTR